MKNYADARREFWEAVFRAAYCDGSLGCRSRPPNKDAVSSGSHECAAIADFSLGLWEKRFMEGPNGTVVPRS